MKLTSRLKCLRREKSILSIIEVQDNFESYLNGNSKMYTVLLIKIAFCD